LAPIAIFTVYFEIFVTPKNRQKHVKKDISLLFEMSFGWCYWYH